VVWEVCLPIFRINLVNFLFHVSFLFYYTFIDQLVQSMFKESKIVLSLAIG
jgi:hypothetical protein